MTYKASHNYEQSFGYYTFLEIGDAPLIKRIAREFDDQLHTAGAKDIEYVGASIFRKSTGHEGRPRRLPPNKATQCSVPTSSHIHIEIRMRAKGVNRETAKALAGAARASGLL